ncbi:nucleotide sugar dehydrogenase [Saccharophagus degradans]|uniref:Nucleotide sugar dehydrogenase n=1 Tax=Saccharophagus degradans TaxID=86304 RepID=A0AAW7X732_9GAMM|nr:nucleotide sugar dehydrogenase [Saccharophagus degradans]MBU2983831.1 nucleotide sugar dehydrogenase [Saccharophagus degradans]MDO6422194.1 nucleotide sugar dehydrogenase [Saccharophagus degradans]MDO6607531.1 nucleotide sugar dehydrogenase [Saccharophagus degradans]
MHNRKISVIGLGYVGLPVAVAFGKSQQTIGFDINQGRVEELQKGTDRTLEVTSEELAQTDILFTCTPADLQKADFHIVAVPTPINDSKQPDLRPLIGASKTLGPQLKKGDIVVYESTVYPGATEEDCVPVLEAESGLKCGVDFFVGYSPERINPGDKEHTFTKITKVVSGQTPEVLEIVAAVYGSVVTAGVHKATSIKVAEAAKVIENTQRDLNIALMNELSVIFNRMDIDTIDVLEAAGTKWNFLPFRPGLVGGHCIGVDPYYLTHKAERMGYNPEVILAGRRINDSMGAYVVQQVIRQLAQADKPIKGAKVAVMGLTFKEDCPDLRNSRVIDVIKECQTWGIEPLVHDPMADPAEAQHEYGVELVGDDAIKNVDALIFTVAHKHYKQWSTEQIIARLAPEGSVFDVKGMLNREAFAQAGTTLWRM